MSSDSLLPEPPIGDPATDPAPRTSRAGRNLPAAIGVGLGLLVLVALSLAFRPEPFVLLAVAAVGAALWELAQAFKRRDIHIPVLPLLVGTAGILVSSYYSGPEALMVSFMLTVAGVVVWRVIDSTDSADSTDGADGTDSTDSAHSTHSAAGADSSGPDSADGTDGAPGGRSPAGFGTAAVRDAAAATFATAYLPFMAGFVMLMLAHPDDGRMRVLLFILLAVANDVGGYVAGVLFGRHPLAPSISPKKSWEGLAGSFVLATVVGVVGAVVGLGVEAWVGVALGVVAPLTATVGDLAESMIKRDLELKDMGSLLPGHGGVLDRLDSMLLTAPFVYVLLALSI